LQQLIDRELTPEEARAYIDTPMDDAERDGILDLVWWFTRRYPTPIERLRYVTRAYKHWPRPRRAGAPPPSAADDRPERS
jgi:hypothetical protein